MKAEISLRIAQIKLIFPLENQPDSGYADSVLNIKVVMESNRLIFEKFKKEDFDDYFKLVGNEDVMKMISGKAIPEKEALYNNNKFLK